VSTNVRGSTGGVGVQNAIAIAYVIYGWALKACCRNYDYKIMTERQQIYNEIELQQFA